MFGSRSDPSTPAQGTTPLTRSRASSSTRYQDDSYMDDTLDAGNPGVNDIMMGAAALPPENPVGFGANFVAGARERENLFHAETTAPTAPVLAPTAPMVNPLSAPLPSHLAATLPVMTPTPVAPTMSAPRRLLSAPPPAPAPAPAPLVHGPTDGGSNVRREEVRGQVQQVDSRRFTILIIWTKRTFALRGSCEHASKKKPVDQSLKKQYRMSSETSSHQPQYRTSFTMRRRTVKSASLMKAE